MTIQDDRAIFVPKKFADEAISYINKLCDKLTVDPKSLLNLNELRMRKTLGILSANQFLDPENEHHTLVFEALLKVSMIDSPSISRGAYDVIVDFIPFLSDDNITKLKNNLQIAAMLAGPEGPHNANIYKTIKSLENKIESRSTFSEKLAEPISVKSVIPAEQTSYNSASVLSPEDAIDELRKAIEAPLLEGTSKRLAESIRELVFLACDKPEVLESALNILLDVSNKIQSGNGYAKSKYPHDFHEALAKTFRNVIRSFQRLTELDEQISVEACREKIIQLLDVLSKHNVDYVRKHLATSLGRIYYCESLDSEIDFTLDVLSRDESDYIYERALESIEHRRAFEPTNETPSIVERDFYVPETALAIN